MIENPYQPPNFYDAFMKPNPPSEARKSFDSRAFHGDGSTRPINPR